MFQFKFKSRSPVTVAVPMNVTKAADTLTAIINRDDAPRKYDATRYGRKTLDWTECKSGGSFVPMSHEVVAEILGKEIGLDYPTAMANPALAEYFALVSDRLRAINLTLAYSRECWYLMRLPAMDDDADRGQYFYRLSDFAAQEPNGVKPSAATLKLLVDPRSN